MSQRIRNVAGLLLLAPALGWGQDTRSPAVGASGMVSSAHPLATEAGVDVLREGGSAFDAAVAVAAALNVVEPMMSGIGGYGTILVYDAANRRVRFLNSSGRIPAKLDSDVFRPPTPGYMENRTGAKAVSTPGNLNAWEAMHKQHWKLPWRRLIEPAIRLAGEGFTVSEQTARFIGIRFSSFPEYARVFYGSNGQPLKTGERLIQEDLARSFRTIAEQGATALHGGELGRAIDSAMKEAGGFLRLDDLATNQAEWWEPIQIEYRGHLVVTASPPANAFDMLVRLGMMSRFDVRALGHNSAAYLHRFAEVTKHGFWTRLRYASDPDVAPPPLDMLLSEKYWADQVARLDLERARPFAPPGVAATPSQHTTHFVVADRWGNVVSATQTLGNLFGSSIMPRGTGIWLNNSLAYSTFEPKGNPMDAFPGRHKLSGDCPTLVFKERRLWAALGTPGGHSIAQTVPQMVMNLVDFGMNLQEALAAPRISFVEPDLLAVEDGIPEAVRTELQARGHKLLARQALGRGHALTIEYDAAGKPSRFAGAADPRGEGSAKGY